MRRRVLNLYAKLFAKSCFKKLNLFLYDISLRGLGVFNYHNPKISGEEFFINYLKENFELNVVFDIGANVGNYSLLFKDLDCNVYSFEPHPKNFKSLESSLKPYNRIQTYNIGFSDTTSKSLIYDYKNHDGSSHASIFKDVIQEIHQSDFVETEINLSTIDSFASEHNINTINLMKIDTEGNEFNVLKGAKEILQNGKVDFIQFEFNEMNVVSKVFLKDFVDILKKYNVYRLLPSGFLKINYSGYSAFQYEIFGFQNIIAIRKDLDKMNL